MAPTMSLHGGPLYASLPSLSMEQPLALTKNSLDAGRPAGLSPTLAPVERQQVCLCRGGGTPSPGCAGGTSCVGDSVCAPRSVGRAASEKRQCLGAAAPHEEGMAWTCHVSRPLPQQPFRDQCDDPRGTPKRTP